MEYNNFGAFSMAIALIALAAWLMAFVMGKLIDLTSEYEPKHRRKHSSVLKSALRKGQRRHALRRFLRRNRFYVHGAVIATIALFLLLDGAKPADWSFLSLSVLCEVA